MELREHKFYYGGEDLNFEIFSDTPCRARYCERISIPPLRIGVDVYEIVPGADTSWVVIKEISGEKRPGGFSVEKENTSLRTNPAGFPFL